MNNKILAAILAVIMLAAALAGCSGGKKPTDGDNVVVIDVTDEPAGSEPAYTAEPAYTEAAPTDPEPAVTEDAPDNTETAPTEAAPTEAAPTQPAETPAPVTPAPTQAPAVTPAPGDYSVFANCAFVGNSTFEGLYRYGVITNSTFFTKVGLNVITVYSATTSTGSVPIIDELNTGSYRAIILMFGQNECGWPSLDTFISKYGQLLNDIWARQPGAKLFITGVPPVSKAVSDKGENGVTNEHINYINNGLKQLAENTPNAYYISVPEIFFGSDGGLRPEASGGDGIHLNLTYTRYWADHICSVVSSIIG